MSGITTAFNGLHARINVLLPNHLRISDPYDLVDNAELELKQGYGIACNGSVNQAREIPVLGCKRSQVKDFEISLTRQFFSKQLDGATKDLVVLELHEDLAILINDFTLNDSLNDGSIVTNWSDEAGIEKVFTDKDNFLSIKAIFSVEIRDILT